MKILNLFKNKSAFQETFFTFYATITYALILCINISLHISDKMKTDFPPVLILGLFFSFSIAVFFKHNNKKKLEPLAQAVLLGILLILHFFVFTNFSKILPGSASEFLFSHLFILSILSIFLSPVLKKKDEKNTFGENALRQISDILLAISISAGIFLILMGVYLLCIYLFEFEINPNISINLFFWLGFFLGSFIVCHLNPKNTEDLILSKSKTLSLAKIDTYILIPGILVYTAILYAYALKIMITGIWPKNQVALLVLIISIVGIAIYIINKTTNLKTKLNAFFEKYFFFLLIPNQILLILALQIRISEYGLTINRAYLAFFAIWIITLTIYFLISKAKELRMIPFSLTIILLLTAVGPFTAKNLSNYFIDKKIQSLRFSPENEAKVSDLKSYLYQINNPTNR